MPNKTQAAVGSGGQGRSATEGRQLPSHCSPRPVVLQVFKRGRWIVAGKIVPLGDEMVLGIVHRQQSGVSTTISVPCVALRYALDRGVRWLYFRRDMTGEMWRLPLADLQRRGWLNTSCGVAEWFVKVADLEPTAWRSWPFVPEDAVVRLGPGVAATASPTPAPAQVPPAVQLDLFGGAS